MNRSFLKRWMNNAADVKDPVDYKNFGEKYCGCAAKEPLDNDAAVQKAVQLCMSRTLIHDAMDSMEDEVGLSRVPVPSYTRHVAPHWAIAASDNHTVMSPRLRNAAL